MHVLADWPPAYSGRWMYLFLAFSVLCLGLAWIALARRGRGAPGLGAALIPVTTLYVVACGINMPLSMGLSSSPAVSDFAGVVEVGYLPSTGSTAPAGAFGLSVAIVAAAAVFALRAPRRAAQLAAAGLLVFGLWQAYLASQLNVGLFGGYYIWDAALWGWTGQLAVVWLAALACVAAGSLGAWPTIGAPMLARRNGLADQVERLTVTRADAVDAAAAELRRLERDLHDGAQARLVALGLSLRAAEKLVRTSPDAAEALIAESRETSARALAELRDLVRGVYPPVLADRGLADAVRSLALDCPVTVTTEIALEGRPPAPVESAVYFAVAEILTNAVTHAECASASIRAGHDAGLLRVMVTDDGIGGADPARGTGLRGIERRLAAFDGILAVNSPAGGPTTVIIEVPCALSWPKISTC